MTDIETVTDAVEKFFAAHTDEGPVTVWTDGITFRGEFDQRVLALEVLNALRKGRT